MSGNRRKTETAPVAAPPYSHALQVQTLSRGRATRFDLRPSEPERAAIATFLGLHSLEALRLKGDLMPRGAEGWRAKGRLTANLAQSCVITLAPVPQKVDERVVRDYLPEAELEVGDDVTLDIEGDDDPDGFTDQIDLGHLLIEALALALEPYPRAPDAELPDQQFAPPGVEPLTDDVLKPFAKLASLREKLAGDDT